jgi:Na+/melibiose symporter-like transporter
VACIFIPSYGAVPDWLAYGALALTVIGVGIGMSAVQILPWASVPDVVEVDEWKHGVRREGAYYGVVQFMYKLASGFSVAFVGWLLRLFGYLESIDGVILTQPDSALLAIRFAIGLLPGILFLISVRFGRRANLDRDRFNEIKQEIKARTSIKDDSKVQK